MIGIYVLAVLLFSLTFALTRLAPSCRRATTIARSALNAIANPKLGDEAKERILQQSALRLFKQSGLITIKAGMAVGAAGLPVWVADVLGLVSWKHTAQFALRWDVILITTVMLLAVWWFWRR